MQFPVQPHGGAAPQSSGLCVHCRPNGRYCPPAGGSREGPRLGKLSLLEAGSWREGANPTWSRRRWYEVSTDRWGEDGEVVIAVPTSQIGPPRPAQRVRQLEEVEGALSCRWG